MPLHLYLAAACVALAVPVALWSVAGARNTGLVRRNLGVVGSSQRRARARRRRLDVARRLLPGAYAADLGRRLDRAGLAGRWSTDRYLAAKTTGMVVAGLAGAWLARGMAGPAPALVPMIAVAAAWLLPDLQLSGKAAEREKELALDLPDVLDQLTISIEAGLGFDAAMARLVALSEGPVVDQMSRVLQDVRLGVSRDVALRNVAARTESADLRTFANAMAQAGRHGLPMASVLRAQAAEAREKRKFRAEEAAHKVPVKILVPLVVCVLPALFIVLVGPAVLRYQAGFG